MSSGESYAHLRDDFREILGPFSLELYFQENTSNRGVIRWWMDGTLIGDYTNISFGTSGCFGEFQLSPTWGGVNDTKNETDYYWYDHVHLSIP